MTHTLLAASAAVGVIRKTSNGEICVDLCRSDAEHLAAPVPEGHDRRACRLLLSDMFPEKLLGKKGTLVIRFEFVGVDDVS